MTEHKQAETKQNASKAKRKKGGYKKPRLYTHGDVRDVTLGASPGVTDSGMMGKDVGL